MRAARENGRVTELTQLPKAVPWTETGRRPKADPVVDRPTPDPSPDPSGLPASFDRDGLDRRFGELVREAERRRRSRREEEWTAACPRCCAPG